MTEQPIPQPKPINDAVRKAVEELIGVSVADWSNEQVATEYFRLMEVETTNA